MPEAEFNHTLEPPQSEVAAFTLPQEVSHIPMPVETLPEMEAVERTVAEQANYQGWWDDALASRLQNPEIKAQFVTKRMEAARAMPLRNPENKLQKVEKTQDHYFAQLAGYDDNLAKIFSEVKYIDSHETGKTARNLGMANYGEYATIFKNAEANGQALTERQKNILLAHELGHSVRDYQGSDAEEIRQTLDFALVEDKNHTYFAKAEEIIERMAQLKNYFGMTGTEKFTVEHLQYAREHYVTDTGFDNLMSVFFRAITPQTEAKFLEVINTYGV